MNDQERKVQGAFDLMEEAKKSLIRWHDLDGPPEEWESEGDRESSRAMQLASARAFLREAASLLNRDK